MYIKEAISRLRALARMNARDEKRWQEEDLERMESYCRGKKQAYEYAVNILKEYQ